MPINPSDEIKSRLDIVDVIREYIQLKPAGINFRAKCPFHREKTPSFMVSPEKQIWHCFGCAKGGDVFSFVMEMEGLSFVEALRQLAPRAGVQLKQVDAGLSSKRNRLIDLVKLSSQHYYENLLNHPQTEAARQYLKKRGFSDETISDWQIGYSLDSWDDLFNYLKTKGYSEEEVFAAGMSVKKEKGQGYYDRFRGRIMFPLCEVNGNPVAFSARVSPEKEAVEKLGKYINSPQTLIYDKSGILFGLNRAKQEIKKNDQAIVVEGQTDVITAHQHGYTNVVASSGTALTEAQIVLLKRYSNNLALAFDMDRAGELAAERGTREAMRLEMNIKIIEIPLGKDPDESIKNNPQEWREAISKAKPMMQYYFDKIFSGLDLSEAENKRRASNFLLPLVVALGNKIEQDHWLKKLSQAIDVPENILRETISVSQKKYRAEQAEEEEVDEAERPSASQHSREELLSELLIALMLKFPEHLNYVLSNIQVDQLSGEYKKELYKNLAIYYNMSTDGLNSDYQPGGEDIGSYDRKTNEIIFNYKDFREWLEGNNWQEDSPPINISLEEESQTKSNNQTNRRNLLDRLALLADKDFHDFDTNQAKKEIINIVATIKHNYLAGRLKEIEKLIAQTEKDKDEKKMKLLLEEFKALIDEMNSGENESGAVV